jgi:hypothetical protein
MVILNVIINVPVTGIKNKFKVVISIYLYMIFQDICNLDLILKSSDQCTDIVTTVECYVSA